MIRKEERRVEKAAAEERKSNEIKSREREAFFGVEKNCYVAFFLIIRETTFSRVFCFVCVVYTKYRLMYFTYRVMVDSDKPSMRTSSMPCVL